MYLDSRRDIGTSSVAKPITNEEIAFLLRSNPPEEEAYEPMGLLVTDGEEVTMAPSLNQIENVIKHVSFLPLAIFCLLFRRLFLIEVYFVLQTLRSHFIRVGTAVQAERLRLLKKLNESRIRNLQTQAALQLRQTQYQDLKSRFPSVVEEAEELKRRLSKAVAPLELIQKIQDLEVQAAAKDEALVKLGAAKDETYAKLSVELEAMHAAHLKNAALLKEALKERERERERVQQVSRCDHFEETCSQLRLEVSQQKGKYEVELAGLRAEV